MVLTEKVGDVTGWGEIPIYETHEPLVPLGIFSNYYDVYTSSIYFGEHSNSPYINQPLSGSNITIFVRESVAQALRKANSLLEKEEHLVVLDGYRTFTVQKTLYDRYYEDLARQNPVWNNTRLHDETQKYVSFPSTNYQSPSPHNTGGSIDVSIFTLPSKINDRVNYLDERLHELGFTSIINPTDDPTVIEKYSLEMEKSVLLRQHATYAEFGTRFDHGGIEAATTYLEDLERALTKKEQTALLAREHLRKVMQYVGLLPYASEWWHFNSPKSQMGAVAAGLNEANYGSVTMSSDNWIFESMRRNHHSSLIAAQESEGFAKENLHPIWQSILQSVPSSFADTPDPRLTANLKSAAVISPTNL